MSYQPYPHRKGTVSRARLDYMEDGLARVAQGGGENPDWDDIENVPERFPAEDHTHSMEQVTGLDAALEAKANTSAIPSTGFGDLTGSVDGVEGATLQEILENLAARTAPEN